MALVLTERTRMLSDMERQLREVTVRLQRLEDELVHLRRVVAEAHALRAEQDFERRFAALRRRHS